MANRPGCVRIALAGLILLASIAAPRAQPSSRFLFDPSLSAEVGAENILSLLDYTGRLEDWALKPRPFEEQGFLERAGGISYRFLKLYFLDELPSRYADVFEHELFGHGYRAREFGYRDLRYNFNLPPPYGRGGAYTAWRYSDSQPPSVDAILAESEAGMEAEQVLGRRLRLDWLGRDSMDYHEALLYIATAASVHNYADHTSDTASNLGNDISSYTTFLNIKEGFVTQSDFRFTPARIARQSEVYLLDPFFWYSVWTVLKTYVWSGDVSFRFPGIPVGWGWHYLPAMGYGLTPFGGEYLFESLLWNGGRAVTASLRLGDETFHRFWGFDAEAGNLASFRGCVFDAAFHLWQQPPLYLSPTREARILSSAGHEEVGFGGSADARFPPFGDSFPVRVVAGLGYKRSGFVPGERLDAGFMWRAGVTYP